MFKKSFLMKYFFIFFTNFARSYNYSYFSLAALVISEKFFPGNNTESKFLNFFVLYPIIFLGKPIGSLIFGLIADKLGKIYMIRLTSILSIFSIFMIIIVPSYSEIGYLASFLVLFCRILFISTTSVEVDALRLFLVEKFKAKILANSMVSFFSQISVLFALLIYKLSMNSFWKIGFFVGAILNFGAILLVYQTKLKENSQKGNISVSVFSKSNIVKFKTFVLSNIKILILLVIIQGIIGGLYHYSIIFFLNFLVVLKVLDSQYAKILYLFMVGFYCLACLLVGVFSVKVKISSYIQIYFALICALCIVFVQYFFLHNSQQFLYSPMFLGLHALFIIVIPFFSLPMLCYIQNILFKHYSLSFYSISHSLGSLLISSTTPMVLMLIWKNTASYLHILQYFIILLIFICLAFTILHKLFFEQSF